MGEQTAQANRNDWVAEQLAEIERQNQDPIEKIEALVSLASEMLPSRAEVMQRAWTSAQGIENEDDRAKALTEIELDYLTINPEAWQNALNIANTISDKLARIRYVVALVSSLPEAQRSHVLSQGLELAEQIAHSRIDGVVVGQRQQPISIRLFLLSSNRPKLRYSVRQNNPTIQIIE